MITQQKEEDRLHYLARVLYYFMQETSAGEYTIDYDETNCDGLCLAQDILHELGLHEDDL